jgi:hypothetical protein
MCAVAAVSCVPPCLGRFCTEPQARAQRAAPRIRRIPIVFAAPSHSPGRTFLPEPRTPPIDRRRRPPAHVTDCAIFGFPTDPHELRMGLRMGAMQAPRWQRCADAREPFRHVQARHHGGRLGRTVHGKFLPCDAFIASLLPRSDVLLTQ